MERKPNTQYVLSYSYGKDSGACIHVIKDILHLPLDRIVTADVWATKDIPAVLPEMWEWQQKADRIILSRYGIPVEHFCATKKAIPLNAGGGISTHLQTGREKLTYEDIFYREPSLTSKLYEIRVKEGRNKIYGFPLHHGNWCTGELKASVINMMKRSFLQAPRRAQI